MMVEWISAEVMGSTQQGNVEMILVACPTKMMLLSPGEIMCLQGTLMSSTV
jgi:hypothetical protein